MRLAQNGLIKGQQVAFHISSSAELLQGDTCYVIILKTGVLQDPMIVPNSVSGISFWTSNLSVLVHLRAMCVADFHQYIQALFLGSSPWIVQTNQHGRLSKMAVTRRIHQG